MRAGTCLLAAAVLAGGLAAQSYEDLTLVRRRPTQYSSVLQARAGIAASYASGEDPAIGLEDKIGLDGHLYYHNDRFTTREAVLDAYAGRDGAVAILREETPGSSGNRIELSARYFPFYREGFYRGGDFIPTGRYEGNDYGAYLGLGTQPAEGLALEVGPFYRRFAFESNGDTDPSYVVPDDFNTYGLRLFLEHNTLALDRTWGVPYDGFVMTVRLEREQNDSDGAFGTPSFLSELPSGMWRARGHLEWYAPQGESSTWRIRLDGSWTDDQDRIHNYDAQKQIGHIWVEGELALSFHFGGLSVAPQVTAQFVRFLQEDGLGSDEDFFFGGGARARWELSDAISLYADYSWLDNESRPPVSATEDTFGEHQLFAGVEVRIGGRR